jgi:hypothetical protein
MAYKIKFKDKDYSEAGGVGVLKVSFEAKGVGEDKDADNKFGQTVTVRMFDGMTAEQLQEAIMKEVRSAVSMRDIANKIDAFLAEDQLLG